MGAPAETGMGSEAAEVSAKNDDANDGSTDGGDQCSASGEVFHLADFGMLIWMKVVAEVFDSRVDRFGSDDHHAAKDDQGPLHMADFEIEACSNRCSRCAKMNAHVTSRAEHQANALEGTGEASKAFLKKADHV